MDRPVYKITIDPEYSDGEDLGIEMIAFTSKPAIKVKGMAFNQATPMTFSDDIKMRIVAPAMIPMSIYRRDEDGTEYDVLFTEEVIESIHAKFMQNLQNKDIFNLEHEAQEKVPAYILEAWIVENPKKDKAFTTYGIEVPKGTLMLTSQVTDKEYYDSLVESGQVGYSIEGFLGLKLSELLKLNTMKLSRLRMYLLKWQKSRWQKSQLLKRKLRLQLMKLQRMCKRKRQMLPQRMLRWQLMSLLMQRLYLL